MRKVLLVHLRIIPHGGGQAVAAWAIQALKDAVDLTVLSWEPVDCEGINRFFGTSISPAEFRSETIRPRRPCSADTAAMPRELLRRSILQRRCRQLDRRNRYDVLLCTDNEMDFGRRGIQYVHFPYSREWISSQSSRWYHRVPGLVPAYRTICSRLGDLSEERIRGNLTLVNSEFVAGKVREVRGVGSKTLFPPVPGCFPEIEWSDRASAFVFIGRIQPSKQVLEVIEIVDRVRRRGRDVSLLIFGTRDSPEYLERVRALAAEKGTWVQIHLELPRARMAEMVAGQRYGIHARHNEHFGIGVAELVRAGCIPFVHDSGGPREIVGPEPPLRFTTQEDAVEKIDRVLGSPALQAELRAGLEEQKGLFTEARFVSSIRQLVLEFDAHEA